MTSLMALLVSSLILNANYANIDLVVEPQVQYVYAEAPAVPPSTDRLGGKSTRRVRGMILPPMKAKQPTIINQIRLVFPPLDLSERG